MNEESLQLLNLSPIPELSEIELSIMLDQLSGFHDQTSDATDRNIEDILREAEELIDKSTCCNALTEQATAPTKPQHDMHANISNNEFTSSELSPEKNVEAHNFHGSNSNLKSGCCVPMQRPNQLLSPDGTANHIKSTIDSLREMSNLMEKEISEKERTNSVEYEPIDTGIIHEKSLNHCFSVRSKNLENISGSGIEDAHGCKPLLIEKSPNTLKKDRANKKDSCFERLYNDKPSRFFGITRSIKPDRKLLKSTNKSSFRKEDKAMTLGKNGKGCQQTCKTSNTDMKRCKNQSRGGGNGEISQKAVHKVEITEGAQCSDKSQILLNSHHLGIIEGPIMLKLLQELQEIKDKIKGNGVPREDHRPKLVWSRRETEMNRASDSDAITRLQEQFYLLKSKYDQQIERLELENGELREALNRDQKASKTTTKNGGGSERQSNMSKSLEAVLPTFMTDRKCSKLTRSLSLENVWITERQPPCEGDPEPGPPVSEAYAQTENERRNVSVQCGCDEEKASNVDEQRTNYGTKVEDKKKMENKENIWQRRKFAPFSDANVPLKQKKGRSEHETQLLVTLRSVQAEAVAKDKENRKLKAEVEMLKAQARRLGQKKMEGFKKCHAGVQTIGLGPPGHRPYDPRLYEAEANSVEKENLELKARVKVLEDALEAFKQKRINDLQSLHQVHEKEMGKLASKLESQSALAKYLHSLLLKR